MSDPISIIFIGIIGALFGLCVGWMLKSSEYELRCKSLQREINGLNVSYITLEYNYDTLSKEHQKLKQGNADAG